MNGDHHLFGRLHESVAQASRILLIAHKKPDGDTIGSSSAFFNWCIREGKDVTAFCRDAPDLQYRFLDNIHRYTTDETVFDRAYDLVIVFDAGDLKYCGVDELMKRLPHGYLLVNLDHHPTNVRFGDMNIVLEDASSTAEIVYRFFEANRVRMDGAMATCLLTGLCTDTSNFSNAATNPLAMQAASSLIAAGGRFQDILNYVWKRHSVDALKIWGLMLSRLVYNARFDVVSTYLLQDDQKNASNDTVEGIANFLNATLGDADSMMILKEMPDGLVKGSFRSLNRDVSAVAKLLGGGGHKKAAGFTVVGRIQVRENGEPCIVH